MITMGITTEWEFTKEGNKTVAQRTNITFTDEEPGEIDRKKMRHLAVLLTKIAKRLMAEEKAAFSDKRS